MTDFEQYACVAFFIQLFALGMLHARVNRLCNLLRGGRTPSGHPASDAALRDSRNAAWFFGTLFFVVATGFFAAIVFRLYEQ